MRLVSWEVREMTGWRLQAADWNTGIGSRGKSRSLDLDVRVVGMEIIDKGSSRVWMKLKSINVERVYIQGQKVKERLANKSERESKMSCKLKDKKF